MIAFTAALVSGVALLSHSGGAFKVGLVLVAVAIVTNLGRGRRSHRRSHR